MTFENNIATQEKIDAELANLRADGFDGNYSEHGSKWSLQVITKAGKSMYVCPLSKSVRYGGRKSGVYKKSLRKWCEVNGIEL